MGDAVSLLKDGSHGTHTDVPHSGYYLLSAKNIRDGRVQYDASDRQISKEEYDAIYRRYSIRTGDVLLSIVGTIGRCCVYEHGAPLAFQRSVAFFRFSKIRPTFAYQYFTSASFQRELLKRQVVSAQPGIYLGDLAEIPIPFPSLEEQQKIAGFLGALDARVQAVGAQLAGWQQWKKGLLQGMFV
ncbi:MAG: restriction endonuclease subunit S [Flavobacteriales bacterium]